MVDMNQHIFLSADDVNYECLVLLKHGVIVNEKIQANFTSIAPSRKDNTGFQKIIVYCICIV